MAEQRTRLASARRYLEVFEESWKADHDDAMRCRDFEEIAAEATKVFELVDELVRQRRECVFRGLQDPNPQLDEEEKNLYADWLRLTEEDVPHLEGLEKTYGVVEGAERLRACREKARTFLAKWAPAVPSMAVGLRVHDLTEEDADELRALLNAPPGAPGRLKWEPRSVPPGDPSALR
jgi:hypothetical protein